MQKAIHPKFLRAKEVAKIGSIGLSTVWLYVKQGKLQTTKPSARITLFNADEVYRLFGLNENEVKNA